MQCFDWRVETLGHRGRRLFFALHVNQHSFNTLPRYFQICQSSMSKNIWPSNEIYFCDCPQNVFIKSLRIPQLLANLYTYISECFQVTWKSVSFSLYCHWQHQKYIQTRSYINTSTYIPSCINLWQVSHLCYCRGSVNRASSQTIPRYSLVFAVSHPLVTFLHSLSNVQE